MLFGSFMPSKRPQSAGPSKVIEELACYLNEAPDQILESGPLHYWKHAGRFKYLSQIALSLFCIPASSANIERIFSVAKDILSAKRNRMKSELFRRILSIRHNYNLLKD